MEKPDYIASDVHLGAVPRETEQRFLRFLDRVGAEARSLLIPGDLFDFWFSWGDVIPGRHVRVLGALGRLVDAGVPVSMVAGNHDAWGGRFLREELGITYSETMLRLELGGRPALVAHGDGVGGGDLKYRALKATIRSRLARGGFRALHPELGLRIARAVSTTEEKAGRDPLAGRARYIQAWALGQLEAEPELTWVVCGHAHVPAIVRAGEGQAYLNAGDWVRNRTYITVGESSGAELRSWD